MKTTFLSLFLAVVALAQTFDVASVKLNEQSDAAETVETSPGTLAMRSVTLITALKWAYGLQSAQISGPGWLDWQRYDISAKAGRPAQDSDIRGMLRILLAERFKIAAHREDRLMTVPVLVIAKGGFKMKESAGDGPAKSTKDLVRGRVIIEGALMADLADQMARDLRTPVLDMTGLKGRYDFELNIADYLPPRGDSSKGTAPMPPVDPAEVWQTMLQKELGLKLEARKTFIEILVIDHSEKTPIEN